MRHWVVEAVATMTINLRKMKTKELAKTTSLNLLVSKILYRLSKPWVASRA